MQHFVEDMNDVTSLGTLHSDNIDPSCGSFSMDDLALDIGHHSAALFPPSTKDLCYDVDVVSKRLQFAIDVIQKAPFSMVLETQTPWSHPFLYRDHMPRSIRGVCISVPTKSTINVAM